MSSARALPCPGGRCRIGRSPTRSEAGPCRAALQALFALALLLPVLFAVHPAQAEVHFRIRSSSYPVHGRTPAAALRYMQLHGPRVEGSPALARTQMTSSLRVIYAYRPGRCSVSRVNLTATFRVKIPRAVSYRQFTPAVRREWRQFVHELRRHELQHARIWQRCLRRVERRLRRMRDTSCARLKRRLSAAFERELARCDTYHDAFDRRALRQTLRLPFVRRALGMRAASASH